MQAAMNEINESERMAESFKVEQSGVLPVSPIQEQEPELSREKEEKEELEETVP